MSAILDVVLGIVTSMGGFVEVGSISTAAQAGSEFGFRLLWAIGIAALMLALLVEMSGRLAVVSQRSVAAGVRERFGIHYLAVLLCAELILDALLLAAEIGGAATAVRLLAGLSFSWWVTPVAFMVWLVLWLSGFSVIEYGVGFFGLVTLSFIVAPWRLGAAPYVLASGFVPSLPNDNLVRYGFLAVSIIGATVSPYLLNFYSSGTLEEQMKEDELWANATTAYAGTLFGSVVSMGVLVTAALALGPLGIRVDSYEQAALMFVPAFRSWAVPLFGLSLGIGCFGAAVEIVLNGGNVLAQAFGWDWGANRPRAEAARFTAAFTLLLVVSTAIALTGVDPLQLTMISLALTVIVLPVIVLPFLVLMNDRAFMKDHTSGIVGNAILAVLTVLGALLALVIVPLEYFGG